MTHDLPTNLCAASSAQICRDRGWERGTLLKDTNGRVIQLTAIGQTEVLARQLEFDNCGAFTAHEESIFNLHCADWSLP